MIEQEALKRPRLLPAVLDHPTGSPGGERDQAGSSAKPYRRAGAVRFASGPPSR